MAAYIAATQEEHGPLHKQFTFTGVPFLRVAHVAHECAVQKGLLKKNTCLASQEVHIWSNVLTQGENEPLPRIWRNLQDACQKIWKERLLKLKAGTREPTYKMLARALCCEVCGVPGQTLMKKATGIPYWKLKVKLLNMNIWS